MQLAAKINQEIGSVRHYSNSSCEASLHLFDMLYKCMNQQSKTLELS